MQNTDTRDIPKRCAYCNKKPELFISIRITHVWKPNYNFNSFICYDHVDKAELDAKREI